MELDLEVVGVAAAWALRELVPVLRRRMAATPAPTPSAADGSGAFAAVPPEGLATRREVQALAEVVGELRAQVGEFGRVIAVLKDRAGID